MNIYSLLDPFSPNVLVHAHFQFHESIFSCMHLLLVAPSHMVRSCPKSLARVQPIRASRPNCGRVLTKSCTTIKPSRAPIRVVQNEYPSRGLTNRRAAGPSKPSSRTAAPRARHAHSAVQTPDTRTRPCTLPSTRPCMCSTRALGRAYARHEHSAAQSCPSHLGPSVLHTLIYEDYVLLLLI